MNKLIIQKTELLENIEKIKERAAQSSTRVIAVLKGNGYGLGLCELAKLLLENGISMLAVSELREAVALRDGGIEADLLLLSPTCDPEQAAVVVERNLICAIGSEQSAKILDCAAGEQNMRARAHILLDTGFGRFGFLPAETEQAAQLLAQCENIDVEGTFTHLSDAFGKKSSHSYRQFTVFKAQVDTLQQNGVNTGMLHICNSCGFIRFADMHLDAVRIGSAFLGRLSIPSGLSLHKIAYLQSEVCAIKTLPKGHNIGYANTHTTKQPTTIAVIPIGYKDGFGVQKINDTYRFLDILRYLFQDGMALFQDKNNYVEINGTRCRLLGRIGMFNVIADVTNTKVSIGDAVTLQCNPILIDSQIERAYE